MPFKKGQSGNPNGRKPKEKTISWLVRQELLKNDVTTSTGERITREQAMARVLTNLAVQGDLRAIGMIFDRIEGPIVHKVEQENKEVPPQALFTSELKHFDLDE